MQRDLDAILETWNSHRIRQVHNSRSPSGRPLVLYSLPGLYGTHDYICHVSDEDMELCKQECTFRKPLPCDADVFEMCSCIMNENDLDYTTSTDEALDLYLTFRRASQTFLTN